MLHSAISVAAKTLAFDVVLYRDLAARTEIAAAPKAAPLGRPEDCRKHSARCILAAASPLATILLERPDDRSDLGCEVIENLALLNALCLD